MSAPSTTPLPMLSMTLKAGKEIDLKGSLSEFIRSTYGEDIAQYSASLETIDQLRRSILEVEKSPAGRDLLYKYFGQFELLELHFPLSSDLKIEYSWADAFNKQQFITQTSPAFEKASIIFNLAALLSTIAAEANRTDDNGLKTACNYFQASAGVFKYVSDHFLHAPSPDMSKDFIAILVEIMLAQAQECFVDKALIEKKKPGIIMKLCAQAAFLYQQSLDFMNDEKFKTYIPPLWKTTVEVKSKYFTSLMHYQRSALAETECKYGEQVARLILADSLIKDCLKISKNIGSMTGLIQLITGGTGKDDSSNGLSSSLRAYSAIVSQKLAAAVKDNDIIYHESVPNNANLAAIDKLAMSEMKKLTEVFPQIVQVVGADLFQNLIPLHVHEQSSVYSQQKDDLLRMESVRVSEADGELAARLASLNLPASLDTLKTYFRVLNGLKFDYVPQEVCEWSKYLSECEHKESLEVALGRLQRTRDLCCNSHQSLKFGPAPPSSLMNDLLKIEALIQSGAAGDQQILSRYEALKSDISLMKDYGKIEEKYSSLYTGIASDQSQNLLDISVERTVDPADGKLLEATDSSIQYLYKLKKDRADIFSSLKSKIQNEDINQLLILNKKNEANVFKVEIEKFSSFQRQLSENIKLQSERLDRLSQDFAILSGSKLALSYNQVSKKSAEMTKELFQTRCKYQELSVNIAGGIKYYQDLQLSIDKLGSKIHGSTLSNRTSTDQPVSSESMQNILQQKLTQLSMDNSLSAVKNFRLGEASQNLYSNPQDSTLQPSHHQSTAWQDSRSYPGPNQHPF